MSRNKKSQKPQFLTFLGYHYYLKINLAALGEHISDKILFFLLAQYILIHQ